MNCSKMLVTLAVVFSLIAQCLFALPLLKNQNAFDNMIKRDSEEASYLQPASEYDTYMELPRTNRKNYLIHEQLMELLRTIESNPQ